MTIFLIYYILYSEILMMYKSWDALNKRPCLKLRIYNI